MSEPTIHAMSTHPCRQCAGPRTVAHMEWRDPAFWVTCDGCGNAEAGTTMDEAVSAWDENNPVRDVSPEEAQDLAVTMVQAHLNPHTLAVIRHAVTAFRASGEPQDVETFLAWCQAVGA